jgi:hypothetical protein
VRFDIERLKRRAPNYKEVRRRRVLGSSQTHRKGLNRAAKTLGRNQRGGCVREGSLQTVLRR